MTKYNRILYAVAAIFVLQAPPPATSAPPAPQLSEAAFLYQPQPQTGVLADVIPFCWKGEYHMLYLQLAPAQKGFDWAQIVTRDFVSYRYTGVGVAHVDASDAVDLNIATGSVIERDGVLYAFYCGQNSSFNAKHKPDQVILLAASRDGLRWTKQPEFRFSPEGNPHYRYPGSCRDPFVFWNPERREYGMLFCATPTQFNGDAAGYAGSADLLHWRLDEPLAASGHFFGYECPDLFRLKDRWYLLFSTYDHNPGWATRYMTARALAGPWESLRDDFLDGGCLYAAKSVSDGKRRFLCGTLPQRHGNNRDDADNGWAGRLVAYEMTATDDGRLAVRIPAEVERSFGESKTITLAGNSRWQTVGDRLQSTGPEAKVYVGKLPKRCLLTVRLVVPPTGRAGLWLGGDAKNEQAFRLVVDVSTQRLSWDRGSLPLGTNPERERNYRPIKIQPGDCVTLKVALDGDAAVACLNDAVCLGTRIYDRRDNTCGVWSDTLGTRIDGVQLRSR
jgi:beta-fructofuranosidase